MNKARIAIRAYNYRLPLRSAVTTVTRGLLPVTRFLYTGLMLKIIFISDIVGRSGREKVKEVLPKLKKKYQPDFIFANAENLAHGKGVTRDTLGEMREADIDYFTSGNHVWSGGQAEELLEDKDIPLLRPANYPQGAFGRGSEIVSNVLNKKALLVNLQGRVFMPYNYDCPFRKADDILKQYARKNVDAILIDFHAEATSEKIAMREYLDGRVTALFGTHTHVPTADLQITEKGTAYISDVGMTGPYKDSVLGAQKEVILKSFLTGMPFRYEPAETEAVFQAVYLEVEDKKASKVEFLDIK